MPRTASTGRSEYYEFTTTTPRSELRKHGWLHPSKDYMRREATGSHDYVRCIDNVGRITLTPTTRGSSRVSALGPIRKLDSKPDETFSAKDSSSEAGFHFWLAGLNKALRRW